MLGACGSRAGGVAVPTPAPIEQPPVASAPPPAARDMPAPLPATPPSARSVPDECAVGVDAGQTPAESDSSPIAAVGLTDRIDPMHAPRPTNESERLLFRQVYETLVRADCMGRVSPGLAASWRLDADGRTWIVTLRENARFSDGTPVSPSDVRASWTRGGDTSLRPEVTRLVESVTETGDRTLAIRLQRLRVDMPLPLAHPDLAVAKSIAGSAWPVGTRSRRVADDSTTSTITITGDALDTMRFIVAPGDPRDLLDRGVDMLLTRNPAALRYAAALPSFQSAPLQWQRTHVLLTPGRARGVRLLSDAQREALADDAVRGEARGAAGPFWWQMLSDCVMGEGQRSLSSPMPRIVYDAGDDVARDLAERFVGLVRASGPGAIAFLDVLLPDRPGRTYQRATGLTGEALMRARRQGADAGYVISLDSHPLDPCRDLQVLTEDARWLDSETIVPLVDTRVHAIMRRGRSSVTAEWDGGLLIAHGEPAGRAVK
jgi:hypothetical protein